MSDNPIIDSKKTAEYLRDMAIAPLDSTRNLFSFINKIIYAVARPQKWKSWLKTYFLDIRYGGQYLGKAVYNGNLAQGWWGSTNSNYEDLSILFSHIKIYPQDVLVDVGCGKGRTFNFFLHQGLKNKLLGVEVDSKIAQLTKYRLRKYQQIEILIGNVEEKTFPEEATIFYLFNPFSEKNLKTFVKKLSNKAKNSKRRLLIVYYHCHYLKVFEEDQNWKIKKFNLKLPSAIIEWMG